MLTSWDGPLWVFLNCFHTTRRFTSVGRRNCARGRGRGLSAVTDGDLAHQREPQADAPIAGAVEAMKGGKDGLDRVYGEAC
jgi:hypothetical protein